MEAGPSFEDDLKQLEAIVEDLERGEPELAAALTKYEQGVRLLARCHGVLDRAEQSVALLAGVDGAGNPVTTPFLEEPSAEPEAAPAARPAAKPRKRPAAPPAEDGDGLIPF